MDKRAQPGFSRRLSPAERWAWDRCLRFRGDVMGEVGRRAADEAHEDGAEYGTARIYGPDGELLAEWDEDERMMLGEEAA